MKYVDDFLNKITIYKLVLYGLLVLIVYSVGMSFFGFVAFSPLSLIYSALALSVSCYLANLLLAKLFKVDANSESYLITAFILFFILFPISTLNDLWVTVLVGVGAMASKYILAIKKKHIFNPTAIAIFIAGLLGSGMSAWWVGGDALIIPVAILGILVLRKVKRFSMFFSFAIFGFLSALYFGFSLKLGVDTLDQIFSHGPLIFLGVIMLTEPSTTPPTRRLQVIYGAIVGILYGVQFHFGPLYSTPEFALIIGNIFAYIVSPKDRLVLTLVQKNKLSSDVYEFVWKGKKINFKAGQYLEWTLGHDKADMRGNRRYFTIASSPMEENLRLGVKFYPNGSSFKNKLAGLSPGDRIMASQLSGEFVLPQDKDQKLAFIAGGIGITPFRSIVQDLLDRNQTRDAVLFFSNKTANDIVYKDVFDNAEKKVGLKAVYFFGDPSGKVMLANFRVGTISEESIKKETPDFMERKFYISGPHVMVDAFEATLKKMGVKSSNIKVDFFPGYV